MVRIYCTKKLQAFIVNVEDELPIDNKIRSLTDWNAHLFFADKRKCLVFVNNLTYYSIYITDILKKDLSDINNIFIQRLKEQLHYDRLICSSESFETTFQISGLKFYPTNNDRRTIGRMNDFVSMFKLHCAYKYGHLKNMDLIYANGLINTTPTWKPGELKKSWSSPSQNMKRAIEENSRALFFGLN